ncbi:MAG TPA: helix-turn-helix domain-containing protein [Caulobacteraceae bacterium]|nr:helix-turn-helix domain-containing protein [Caulobacteraceae bacterium]
MNGADELQAQAERLRATGALGRSAPIHKLFDYLLARSLQGEAPKEVEVAEAVFGRTFDFDVALDSTVRVYVHRLRKKLDDFYSGPGKSEPVRLAIPKGEYRLVAVSREQEEEIVRLAPEADGGWMRRWTVFALAGLLAINLAGFGALWWKSHEDHFAWARRAPAWTALIKDSRPITVVLGDYYIFGELDEHREVDRLVREYNINSPEDLSNFQMSHPDKGMNYLDLDLYYLPTSIGPAMRSLMPVLAPDETSRERIRVITASHLTPDMLKRNDIVYIGYLSGLGLLRDTVLDGSRFRIGETFDELIDVSTGKHYLSQEGGPEFDQSVKRDYGYFASFEGQEGNRFMIIAGTRDVAVMNTAEAIASREGLKDLSQMSRKDKSFEALYEVMGVNRVNLRGKLLLTSPLRFGQSWGPPPKFPAN